MSVGPSVRVVWSRKRRSVSCESWQAACQLVKRYHIYEVFYGVADAFDQAVSEVFGV